MDKPISRTHFVYKVWLNPSYCIANGDGSILRAYFGRFLIVLSGKTVYLEVYCLKYRLDNFAV